MQRQHQNGPEETWTGEETPGYFTDATARQLHTAAGETPVYVELLRDLLPTGATVLDVGAGVGKDVHLLSTHGLDVVGVEADKELVSLGRQQFGLEPSRLKRDSLPGLNTLSDERFGAVICASVLQNVADADLLDALYALKQRVADGGLLVLTVPTAASTGPGSPPGCIRSPQRYQFFLSRLGLDLLRELDVRGSSGAVGTNELLMLFGARKTASGLRPIETLESILIEDAKVNSYKYALLRALSDLATSRYNAVEWQTDGTVTLEIDFIARKWIEYYWPIVAEEENGVLILQGQKIANKSDITFRAPLLQLVRAFGNGGLTAFTLALESDALSASTQALYRETLRKVRRGIEQPVQYAGNKRTGEAIFRKDRSRIVIPAALWTELSLMGRWVADSIVLRWAEFTENRTHQTAGVTKETVLPLLLQRVETDRRVQRAHNAYERLMEDGRALECVWSGKVIKELHVDHAIPFALWGNNDLWNLLPASKAVNLEKRAKLPSRALVEHRRGSIIRSWEHLYEAESALFLHHAADFLGESLKTFDRQAQAALFSTFKDAIEYTAQNRLVDRWDGAA